MKLSIIIVNYKTPNLTLRCLSSIYSSNVFCEFEIIIIDNCSNDNSEQLIMSIYPNIIWINNNNNEGFGRANNLAARFAKGKYILLLNSDMLVLQKTIDECIIYLDENSNIGALGCKLLNEDGSLQKSFYYYAGDYMNVLKDNLVFDYIFKPKSKKIKAIMGAFMMMPLNIFNDAGGFDPDFFMYAEELDLCRRIAYKNYNIVYYDKITAIHKHGGSSNGSDWTYKQNYLSNALLYLKVKGIKGYFIYHFLMNVNLYTNMLLIWKMDRNYRKDFWQHQNYYFSNFVNYLKIPFLYSKSMGNGKRLLKRA
jgi:GT2 family glycosyltransferase